jgi:hypothetical protein
LCIFFQPQWTPWNEKPKGKQNVGAENRGGDSMRKQVWETKINSHVHECKIDEENETTVGKSEEVMMRK